MKLPSITTKQQDILNLIYRYRYLNRIQVQTLMGHKDKSLVSIWLKDLREKQYVDWIYSTDFTEKTKPAIYYLGNNGVRWLKSTGAYPTEELRKRYRESGRSESFITGSVLITECCIDLKAKSGESVRYEWQTQADYADPASEYHFLHKDSPVNPQLVIRKQENQAGTTETTTYLLELFDASLPQYRIRKRLKEYVTFLLDGVWIGVRDDPEPIVLVVCPSLHILIYAKWRIRKYLQDKPNAENVKMQLTTTEALKRHSVTAEIWEEV